MTAFIALFRGINVGGNKIVKMGALKKLHETLGFRDVRTYVQSGNVVFKSDDSDAAKVALRIESEFERACGFPAKVILRTPGELRVVVRKNPFQGQEGKEAKLLHVVFLSRKPGKESIKELLSSHHGPEELYATDMELYIYYTNGAGRSKLTNALIERKLKVSVTARNWNTVIKLIELGEA